MGMRKGEQAFHADRLLQHAAAVIALDIRDIGSGRHHCHRRLRQRRHLLPAQGFQEFPAIITGIIKSSRMRQG